VAGGVKIVATDPTVTDGIAPGSFVGTLQMWPRSDAAKEMVDGSNQQHVQKGTAHYRGDL